MDRDTEDGIDISISIAHRVMAYFHTCHPESAPDWKLRECLQKATEYYGGGYRYIFGCDCWKFEFHTDGSSIWLYDNRVVKTR